MNNTHYIVQTAAAHMPNSCWGRYGKVAILEVDEGVEGVKMISERAKGVIRIVALWDRQHIGKTEKGAFQRCVAAAKQQAGYLNQQFYADQQIDKTLEQEAQITV